MVHINVCRQCKTVTPDVETSTDGLRVRIDVEVVSFQEANLINIGRDLTVAF